MDTKMQAADAPDESVPQLDRDVFQAHNDVRT